MDEAESILRQSPCQDDDEEDDGLQFHNPNPRNISHSQNFLTNVVVQRKGKPQQKCLLCWHLLLKIVADVIYLCSSIFGMGYILTFIVVVLLLSADFWITKNVSGRLLAGLRWWNVVDGESGEIKWIFESWPAEDKQAARQFQVRLFWLGMVIQQGLWMIFSMVSCFTLRLSWFVINLVGVTLNGANLMGYVRCRFFNSGVNNQTASPSWSNYWQERTAALFSFGRHLGGGYYSAAFSNVDTTGHV